MEHNRNWAEAALKLRTREATNHFLASKQTESTFLSSAITLFINSICLFEAPFFANLATVEFKLIGDKYGFDHKPILPTC
jgi:hypothetical protein